MTVRYGSDQGTRSSSPVPARKRQRCECCKRRATHYGLGDGVVLMSGCEFYVQMWIKSPAESLRFIQRLRRSDER